ncbi:MAG: putative metal-binding motif-containing protein [Myxococcota bacterium]
MRTSRWLVFAGVAVAVLAVGCSGKPSTGGLQVKVHLEPGLRSTCVRVEVRPAGGGGAVESGPIVLAGKTSPLIVGVANTGQAQPVTVQAVGYADTDCNSRTAPPEVSNTASGSFADPVTVLEVTLAPASTDGGTDGGADGGMDGGVDMDGDGFFPPEDCNDNDFDIKPGVQELCTDRVDNDCDQLTDCADSTCDQQMCGVVMSGGGQCNAGVCQEIACGDSEDNDGDGVTDCRDVADCAGQMCGVGGTCDGADGGRCVAPNETSLCADGMDNDNDTLIDCLDPDCPMGSACSDLDACTSPDTCGSDGGCVPGSGLMCTTPPNQCFDTAGSCRPDAGVCEYPKVVAGGACDDGRACTKAETCDGDGGCVGTPKCDAPPNSCFAALGTCNEADGGGCDYTPLATGPCSDGNNCTINDTCDGDGGCAGAPVTCTSTDQCQAPAGCTDAGACLFAITVGASCDAGPGPIGACTDAGTCVVPPTSIFPFTPSNFTEMQLPPSAGALNFNCVTTTLDTQAADGGIGWTNACGAGSAPYALVSVGTQTAVLIFADSLDVASNSTLRAIGARPLILAVRNGATINGTIDVGSTDVGGAGSDQDCGGGFGMPGGTATPGSNLTAGGGGGGAFGTNGALGGPGNGGAAGGDAGVALGGTRLEPLRGGCRGGHGGRQAGANGLRGRGGGAVQLTVGGTLQIAATGRVTAYGAGGTGGSSTSGSGSGGGGGGSGGGILLEAATLNLLMNGAITANGGAGGEGGGVDSTGSDGPGGSPNTSNPATTIDSSSCGGTGGSGGAGMAAPTGGGGEICNSSNSGQGGGGGGGVGRIFLRASTACMLNGVISPPAHGNGMFGCPAP